jgi:hypothetical protein
LCTVTQVSREVNSAVEIPPESQGREESKALTCVEIGKRRLAFGLVARKRNINKRRRFSEFA